MEGVLRKYKNFMSGYKECWVKLRHQVLVIQNSKDDKGNRIKINLTTAMVEASQKDGCEFIVSFQDYRDKQKLYLKASSQSERDKWVNSILEAVIHSSNNSNTPP